MARVLGADVYVHWTMGFVPLALLTLLAPGRPPFAHLWASGAVRVGSGTVLLTPLAPLAHGAPPAPCARTDVRAALAGPAVHGLWALAGAAALTALPWSYAAAEMIAVFV